MAVGFGGLRLSSADFWAMTPRELAAAIDGLARARGGAAGPRTDSTALMTRFPDRRDEKMATEIDDLIIRSLGRHDAAS